MLVVVSVVDAIGDRVRSRILRGAPSNLHGDAGHAQPLEPKPLAFSFGAKPIAIRAVELVAANHLVVRTGQELPEGSCYLLKPELPMGATAQGLVVRARRVTRAAEAGAQTEFAYELTACEASADVAQLMTSNRDSDWQLDHTFDDLALEAKG